MKRDWFEFYEKGVPTRVDIPETTLWEIFQIAVKASPRKPAIFFHGKQLTYDELGNLVDQFATALSRLGVSQGDPVALVLPNLPQYVIAHFAVLKLGAILVPTNPLYVEREVEYQLNDSETGTVIVLDLMYPRVEAVKPRTRVQNIIVTSASDYLPPFLKLLYPIEARRKGHTVKIERRPGVHFFSELMSEPYTKKAEPAKIESRDVATLLYTGGTTGISKGAILTHKNLVANIVQISSWLRRSPHTHETNLCALPFFHSYGLTTGLHMSVFIQATMVLIPNPRDIKAILRSIQKTKATLFSGVPTLYIALNNFPKVSEYNLSSIKACISGGAPLPLEVAKKFEAFSGGRLVEGYGLSECSPVTHTNPINGMRKEGSIGLPLPETDARIVDAETKEELAIGEVGELAVSGPQVMQGYWNMPAETEMVLRDGWLYTGDLAKRDNDGYFYIVDRKKDMIIAGGYNIFPREIEEVLFQHPAILEAAVLGKPDEYRGETVKAYIVCKENEQLTADEVIDFCRTKLAKYKVPRYIEFCESLPKSSIGKILKRALSEELSVAQELQAKEIE